MVTDTIRVSIFYLQNPSAAVGEILLALGFPPQYKNFAIKEWLGCKEDTQKLVVHHC